MIVYQLKYPIPIEVYLPSAMAIGYFDGVHLGHRRVIQKAIDLALKESLNSAVMTFDPHPREVLGKSGFSKYLTPLEDKLVLFEKMGVDLCYVVHFDIAFASVYPEDFIDEVIIPLQAKHVVTGFDYTFGYRGAGTAQTLKENAQGRYGVDITPPVNRFGEKVSSTVIRESLHRGDVEQATLFLGRPYLIRGKVVHGDGRGKTLGFPTANLEPSLPYIVPKNGVYGVRVHVGGQVRSGIMNIGMKPTFNNQKKEKSLEIFIFDLDMDLYDQVLTVEFIFFQREEQKFASVNDLVTQINRDIEEVKYKLLAEEISTAEDMR